MLPTRKIIRYNFLKHLWQSQEHLLWALKELQRSHGRSATVASIRFPWPWLVLLPTLSPCPPVQICPSWDSRSPSPFLSVPHQFPPPPPLKFCLATKKHDPMHCSDDTNAVSNYIAVSKFPSQLSRFSSFLNHPSRFTVSLRLPGPKVLEENQRAA